MKRLGIQTLARHWHWNTFGFRDVSVSFCCFYSARFYFPVFLMKTQLRLEKLDMNTKWRPSHLHPNPFASTGFVDFLLGWPFPYHPLAFLPSLPDRLCWSAVLQKLLCHLRRKRWNTKKHHETRWGHLHNCRWQQIPPWDAWKKWEEVAWESEWTMKNPSLSFMAGVSDSLCLRTSVVVVPSCDQWPALPISFLKDYLDHQRCWMQWWLDGSATSRWRTVLLLEVTCLEHTWLILASLPFLSVCQ